MTPILLRGRAGSFGTPGGHRRHAVCGCRALFQSASAATPEQKAGDLRYCMLASGSTISRGLTVSSALLLTRESRPQRADPSSSLTSANKEQIVEDRRRSLHIDALARYQLPSVHLLQKANADQMLGRGCKWLPGSQPRYSVWKVGAIA